MSDPARRIAVFWRYDDLEAVDERFGDGPLRLRLKDGEARLALGDPALIDELLRLAPGLHARRSGWIAALVKWTGMTAARAMIRCPLCIGSKLPRRETGLHRLPARFCTGPHPA